MLHHSKIMSNALKNKHKKIVGKREKKMRGPMRELKPNPIVQHEGITSGKNINFIFIPIIDIDI